MLSSAATFSFFLAIGSVGIFLTLSMMPQFIDLASCAMKVIRSDALVPPHIEAARMQLLSPIIRSKADGAALMRARWDAERKLLEMRKTD
jgi:hypothetical protein